MMLHPSFRYNGRNSNEAGFVEFVHAIAQSGESWEKEHVQFILDWMSDEPEVVVNTSGSTGEPKVWHVRKELMVNSARLTANFFSCFEGTRALLCLPSTYIAGKMMLARAMVLGWDLRAVAPVSKPLSIAFGKMDFAAFTPMQLAGMTAEEQKQLESIAQVIVGGAAVSDALRLQLARCSNSIFETYGMAETLSHVALRRITQSEESFVALEGVRFSLDEKSRLRILAPHIGDAILQTQDAVELTDDKHFFFRGRYDQMINSGGIKLFPDAIERKLGGIMKHPFYITAEPDEVLGQRVVLYVETTDELILENCRQQWEGLLERVEFPKVVYTKAHFERTSSGKIIRNK
jgi:O-succinylbenzoic acid--CoA ligase